ncbi:MAG: hypothetical protein HC898_11225 [Phycisphaerales bacterium]|nr:hypothetical protein [Phycisphaerales bacterium]
MMFPSRPNLLRMFSMGLAMLLLVGTMSGCNSILRRQALDSMAAGDLSTADVKLRRAIVQNPGDYRAHWYLAEIRLRQKQPLAAQQLLGHALKQHPDGPDTPKLLDLMAESLYQQNEPSLLTSFLADTASQRKNVSDYLRQARYLSAIGDTDGVNLAFLKGAKFAKVDDPRPYLAAIQYYESIQDRERVVTALRHAYYIKPNDPKLQEQLRRYGIVPGPTVGLAPLSQM